MRYVGLCLDGYAEVLVVVDQVGLEYLNIIGDPISYIDIILIQDIVKETFRISHTSSKIKKSLKNKKKKIKSPISGTSRAVL